MNRKTLSLAFALLWAGLSSAQAMEIQVAASANLRYALTALGEAFKASTGHELRVTYGSCGQFVREILREAPFEILFCSNRRYVDLLVTKGSTLDEGHHFANDQLALFIPNGSSVAADPELLDLTQALDDARMRRLAITAPELSPFGLAARTALERQGIWQILEPYTRLGGDPQATLDFTLFGEAEAALVPMSLAQRAQQEGQGLAVAVDYRLAPPLTQHLVLLKKARSATLELANLLRTTEARELLHQHYFLVGR